MATITLTDGSDTYTSFGGTVFDPPTVIDALGGNDIITVEDGFATQIFLGDGDDFVLDSGGVFITVSGGNGNDRVDVHGAHLSFDGGNGNDVVNGYGGQVDGVAGAGADTFNFFADLPAIVWGEDGDDVFDANNHAITGTIYGGAGNDTFLNFRAPAGSSTGLTLDGGPGNDIFRGTVTGFDGITIADFNVGDMIWIAGINADFFSFSVSGNILTYNGHSITFGSPLDGTIRAFAFSGRAFFTLVPHVANDFNGDGRSDVLLKNVNGMITDWLSQDDGTFFSNHANATYALPSGWDVAGTGDFNGDGRSDVLLRNDNGSITEWLGQANGSFNWNAAATIDLDSGWIVAGVGDFNGDGRDDVLLRYSSGTIIDWLGQASGTFFSNHANATYALPSGWDVAGTGDFNGDGRSDVLLRNGNGSITEWLGQADGSFDWNAAATYAIDPAWNVSPSLYPFA